MNCLNCIHCHPLKDDQIRCDHPIWEQTRNEDEDDTDMRTFNASFGAVCAEFEEEQRNKNA